MNLKVPGGHNFPRIFPLTKKTTFVRFIEVIQKGIFLLSVSCFFGGGNVSHFCFHWERYLPKERR